MIGEKIQEVSGKVTGTRVVPSETDIPRVETSFQGQGRLLGVETTEFGSYTAVLRPGGTLFGQGQGVAMSKDGDSIAWTGFGIGKPTGRGVATSYRYSVTFQTTSQKWSRLNGTVGVGEWEIDEHGNAKGTAWEWK